MRFKNFLVILLLCPLFFIGQTQNPVTWTGSYTSLNESEGEITITANIEMGWHIYSQRLTDAGPINTSFTFTPAKNFELKDKTTEENAKEEFDKAFEAKVFSFEGKAVFKQKIKRLNPKQFTTVVKLEYVSCNSTMCLPPKVSELSINIPAFVKK